MQNGHPEKTASALKIAGSVLIVAIMLAGLIYTWLVGSNEMVCNEPSVLRTIQIDKLTTEIADTEATRTTGLSGRECISENRTMLFIFDNPSSSHCIWMKDMNFAIDIVWLSESKQIIDIERGAQPDSYPHEFCPSGEAKYVLEAQKGLASQKGWITGTRLDFNL